MGLNLLKSFITNERPILPHNTVEEPNRGPFYE